MPVTAPNLDRSDPETHRREGKRPGEGKEGRPSIVGQGCLVDCQRHPSSQSGNRRAGVGYPFVVQSGDGGDSDKSQTTVRVREGRGGRWVPSSALRHFTQSQSPPPLFLPNHWRSPPPPMWPTFALFQVQNFLI